MKLPWRRSPDEAYLKLFEKIQDEVLKSGVPDRTYLLRLTDGERRVYALGTLEREVLSVGWEGYFWNSSGDTFLEATEAAATLGVSAWTKLLDEAAQSFPDGYSTDINERQSQISSLDDTQRAEVFGPLDKRVYAMDEEGRIPVTRLLSEYVDQHPDEFADGDGRAPS